MSGEYSAFFYGTLMAPEVFFSVCYGVKCPPEAIRNLHTFTPAVLSGYCRHRVYFADYPAIVPEEGQTVLGIYATGLTEANLQKLDHFEGSDYDRVLVRVKLYKDEKNPDGEEKETSAYVFNQPEDVEEREWDFDEFRREKMGMWTRGEWAFNQDLDDKATARSAV